MYKRSQIIWALWNCFGSPSKFRADPKDVPSSFVKRVTALIEHGVGVPPERRVGQSGLDQEYDEIGVFEIAIGLHLLDVGVNRSEAANFVLAYREQIIAEASILAREPTGGRVFMVLRPSLLPGAHTEFGSKPGDHWGTPFMAPEFFRSAELVTAAFLGLWFKDAARVVIEVQDLFLGIVGLLSQSPLSRRGRRA